MEYEIVSLFFSKLAGPYASASIAERIAERAQANAVFKHGKGKLAKAMLEDFWEYERQTGTVGQHIDKMPRLYRIRHIKSGNTY